MNDKLTDVARRRHLPVVLTVADVAIALDISRGTAARWLREGRLGPTIRLGRRRAILKESLLQHLARLEAGPAAGRLAIVSPPPDQEADQ